MQAKWGRTKRKGKTNFMKKYVLSEIAFWATPKFDQIVLMWQCAEQKYQNINLHVLRIFVQ